MYINHVIYIVNHCLSIIQYIQPQILTHLREKVYNNIHVHKYALQCFQLTSNDVKQIKHTYEKHDHHDH